jgi:ATP-binding cassette, subfamily B, bacterial PglK
MILDRSLAVWRVLDARHKRRFAVTTLLMFVVSCAEMLSVGAIFPLLALLAAPEKIFRYHAAAWIASRLGIESAAELMVPLALAFAAASILAGVMRTLLIHRLNEFSFDVGSDLGVKVYEKVLRAPYAKHVASRSSDQINLITYKTRAMVEGLILPVLFLGNSVFMAVLICIAMAAINAMATFASIIGFTVLYVAVYVLARRATVKCGKEIAEQNAIVVRSVQDGLGGIRDIILDGSYDVYANIFRDADRRLKKAQGLSNFIMQSPRFAMESIGIALIAMLALLLAKGQGGISSVLPTLGALALGAQRLLPVLHQAYSSTSSIKGNARAANDILAILTAHDPRDDHAPGKHSTQPLAFRRELVLEHLAFKYRDDLPAVLSNVDLVIPRGARVGIVGVSGSGKSTLIDIIMGLLEPTQGRLLVDGKAIDATCVGAWRGQIAHVPQNIYLADMTVYENIAFGIPMEQIDQARAREAARRAHILDEIERLPEGFDTLVGERGGRLSGGQRQRLGIARALYKKASVIVLDEATSALDSATEAAVISSLYSIGDDVTLISITHRPSTLAGCTEIIQVDAGVVRQLSREEYLVG